MQNDTKEKLNIKDLINVGLFTAIYFVIFLISTSTSFIPIMIFVFSVLSAFLAGIPMVLFLSRVKKFGMVTIMCVLLAIIIFIMGYGPIGAGITLLCGILADLILKAGNWQSWKSILAAYTVFSLWAVGTLVPIIMMGDAYFEGFRESMGDAYVNDALQVMHAVSGWLIPVVGILTAVAAIAGAFLGKAVLKKHFKRAGIA